MNSIYMYKDIENYNTEITKNLKEVFNNTKDISIFESKLKNLFKLFTKLISVTDLDNLMKVCDGYLIPIKLENSTEENWIKFLGDKNNIQGIILYKGEYSERYFMDYGQRKVYNQEHKVSFIRDSDLIKLRINNKF